MEDVVAVEVMLDTGERRYFMTWGRVHEVKPEPLEALVLKYASRFALGGKPTAARVCSSLAEAKSEPFFYEALLSFAWSAVPFGEGYEDWRRERRAAMRTGHDIYYLGQQR